MSLDELLQQRQQQIISQDAEAQALRDFVKRDQLLRTIRQAFGLDIAKTAVLEEDGQGELRVIFNVGNQRIELFQNEAEPGRREWFANDTALGGVATEQPLLAEAFLAYASSLISQTEPTQPLSTPQPATNSGITEETA